MAGCAGCAAEVLLEDTFCPRCGAPVTDPFIGVVVGDRYRIVSRIGVGGMGAVYRAEHTMMRRDLAIKVLLPGLGGKEEFARRFEREAESASRLDHPNIISVTDFGHTPDGSLFLVMEYLAGLSLTSVISEGPLPVARALKIIRQILRGLEHAHGAGIVHRDLKPDNIMLVERDGQPDVVKILDFGIAKVTEPLSGSTGREVLTQAGVIFGTPEYLSPEQALGEPVDARADIYAAGVILFEMLAGRRPFESDDKVKIISMHLAHAPPRIREVSPTVELPTPLEQAVLQSLEKSRENRFASAGAFLQALEDAEAPGADPDFELDATVPHFALDGTVLRPPTPRRWSGRRLAAAVALGAALIAGGIAVVNHRGPGHALDATPAKPAPPPPDMAERFKRVEALLEDGNTAAARRALEQALSERPKDGRVHYMLGRVAYADDNNDEALTHYRQAIALDAGFRGDPVLLAHVGAMLVESRDADEALDLLIGAVGAPAADLLQKAANEGTDLERRQRAATALDDIGQGKRVDRVSLAMLDLRKGARTCDERKALVEKLRAMDDPRALPALRELRGRNFGPFRVGSTDTSCMKKELPEAIKALEKKAGVPERRTRRGR
jgi:eukaryotic-like serine/threonine-protein kinase